MKKVFGWLVVDLYGEEGIFDFNKSGEIEAHKYCEDLAAPVKIYVDEDELERHYKAQEGES